MEFYVSKRKPIIIWPILNIKASFPEGTWRNILVSIWLHPKHGSWKIISTRIHFFFLSMVSRCIVVLKNDRIHYESLYGTVEYLIKHHYVSWCQNGTSLTSLLFNHWPKKIKVKGSLPHSHIHLSIWGTRFDDITNRIRNKCREQKHPCKTAVSYVHNMHEHTVRTLVIVYKGLQLWCWDNL